MNKNVFKCPAMITKFETRSDKTNKVIVNTQELDTEQRSALSELTGNYGMFVFASEGETIDTLEIPDITPEFPSDKSPSQRLRNVIYKAWEAQHIDEDFDHYYKRIIETLITYIKDKYLN